MTPSSAGQTPTQHIGLLLFPRMTQLDFTGPYEVFARFPNTTVHAVAAELGPVKTDRGLVLMPSVAYAGCPQLDVIVVPGGPGQLELMTDETALGFLRRQAVGAKYITSVCTGALVLGAAGLLTGYRATTHWTSLPLLKLLGAIPEEARVVVDRNRITGGGVTAGIDFGLRLAAILHGERVAQQIQLQIEYDPDPPFRSGSPRTAPADLVTAARQAAEAMQARRLAVCEAIAAQRESRASG